MHSLHTLVLFLLCALSARAQIVVPLPPIQAPPVAPEVQAYVTPEVAPAPVAPPVISPPAQPEQPAPILKKEETVPVKIITAAKAPPPARRTAKPATKEEPKALEEPAKILTKEEEIKRVEALPAFNLQTSNAVLSDVLTLLADACRMSYVGLEKGLADDVQISVNINKNPYQTLQYLAERYNIALDYDNGIWHFALFNDEELIARLYHLRYNDQAEVGGGSGDSGSSSSSSSSSSTSSSGTGGGGVSSSADSGFSLKNDIIAKDIEKFLGMSSENPAIMSASDFDVEALTSIDGRGIKRVLPKAGEASGAEAAKGSVIYNADTRTMYILATRAQHQWIEKYIKAFDKPLRQILVETKIYETGLNPDTTLGVRLTGTLKDGNNTVAFGAGNAPTAGNGLSAILTANQFQASLSALTSDSNTTSVNYPRQVTISSRPVAIASTQQVPVQQSTTSTSTGGSVSSQTQTSVEYIDVGTNISILPRIIDGNKVQMDISVTVSSIASFKTIGGNDYPQISKRNYRTQAIVESGYTLAIAGLKETSSSDTVSGVPVLSKAPIVGSLFRKRQKTQSDKNLLIFISPVILDKYRGGVSEDPQFVTARDDDSPARRIFRGTPEESYTDIMLGLAGMDREIRDLSQRIKEYMDLDSVAARIAMLKNELKLMDVRLREIALQQPNKDVSPGAEKIQQYLNDLNELSRSISKKRSIL